MPAWAKTTLAFVALLGLVDAAAAQDILHYKFDGACGSIAINYAAGSPAPAVGSIPLLIGAPSASWTAGRFGLALARGGAAPGFTANYVDTGWAPNGITGSLSWACWLKVAPGVTIPVLNGVFGGGTFTWSLLSNQFLTSSPNTLFPAANLVALAQTGWTHVAVVLDAATSSVTYYINGIPQPPLPFTGVLNWTATGCSVGRGMGTNTAFDIDEFILANRAMSAAEIAVLATDPRGADGAFAPTIGPVFLGNGQRPIPGNQSYGFTLNANAGLAWCVFGQSRCTMNSGTIPLPVDLGQLHPLLSGLLGRIDSDLGALSLAIGTGATSVPFPLPNLPGLSGFQCYGQALVLDGATLQFASSNALAIGIGR